MTNSEMKNPVECRSAGVLGRWSNLATPPVRHIGCRIFEQKGTKETKREFRFEMGTSLSLFASVQNPSANQAKSSQIKPNRAIFPFSDATAGPKTAKFRNWQLPRSVLSERSDRSGNPQLPTTPCGAPSTTPQEFHLIPLDSTSSPPPKAGRLRRADELCNEKKPLSHAKPQSPATPRVARPALSSPSATLRRNPSLHRQSPFRWIADHFANDWGGNQWAAKILMLNRVDNCF